MHTLTAFLYIQKLDSVNPHQADVWESLIRPEGGKYAHQGEIGHICYIFAFQTTKNVSRDSRDTQVDPH